jgi:hypothetical protein
MIAGEQRELVPTNPLRVLNHTHQPARSCGLSLAVRGED